MPSTVEVTPQSAEEMRRHLIEKAVENAAFRQELVSDPKGVIREEFGIEVPENIEIRVHENSRNVVHLALPADIELEEEQLERIAGGTDMSWTIGM